MKVKYLGHKKSFPIYLPIGARTRSSMKQTIMANPYAELTDSDARQLVEMSPKLFAVEQEIESDDKMEMQKPLRKAGRPKKASLV